MQKKLLNYLSNRMIKTFNKFIWWLDLTQSNEIADNSFTIAKNVFYNNAKQIETRKGYVTFAPELDDVVTSTFFFQRDDTLATMLLAVAGTKMYKYVEWTDTRTQIKTWLTEYEPLYPTQRTRWDFCVYKNIVYMCNWVDNYASYDWTTYTEYASQPKVRYLQYLQDRILAGWDDDNPSTLYYTNAAPTNGNTINGNVVIVWGDEAWKINAITEFWRVILVGKSNKVYTVDVANQSSIAVDTQSWMRSDRCISNVNNDLMYFNERGIDAMKTKQYDWWLETKPLSEKVREVIENITPSKYNSNVAYYIRPINNYYFSFDANDDDIPDTHLIYNTTLNARTQFDYPGIYDYTDYINQNNETFRLFASGTQLYRMEAWFTDNTTPITAELQTKDFDFWDPAQLKTYWFVDLVGRKQVWAPILVKVIVNDEIVAQSEITDGNLNLSSTPVYIAPTISEETIGTSMIWWWVWWIEPTALYPYTVKLPMFARGYTIQVKLMSTGVQRQFEKLRIDVDGEPKEMFYFNDII